MGNCSKKRFFQLGIKTARRARKRGVFGIHKTNYVVKTTEFAEKPRAGRGNVGAFGNHKMNYVVKTTEFAERPRGGRRNWVFSGFTKRIPLLKQRNSQRNRAVDEGKGCFGDLQNEFRCKNNGIRGETVRRARKLGVLGIHKTNYVVKTTELGEETARHAQKLGVLGIHKTNSVVKTTEFAEKPRGVRRNGVFWGFTKRIPL